MSREKACEACGGTGKVTELTTVEKIRFHAQVAPPNAALVLSPAEVADLLNDIGAGPAAPWGFKPDGTPRSEPPSAAAE